MSEPPGPHLATRLLIVDDDRELCELMLDFLRPHGLLVRAVQDGPTGLREALGGQFDVVTLDVMLPGLDGFEILRQLRRRSAVPVIMLTARTTTEDRIAGLEAGADDYLPKPFHPGELLARVRAVLRRAASTTATNAGVAEAGGVRVNAAQRQAWCKNVLLPLTTAEFEILDLLIRRAGLVVSRDDVATALYQRPASPYERGLDVHVSHLRRKLQAAGVDPIRTVRAVGYLFARD